MLVLDYFSKYLLCLDFLSVCFLNDDKIYFDN